MSAIAIILLLILALIFGFGAGAVYEEGPTASEVQACVAVVSGETRCSPTLVDGEYQVPVSGITVQSIVNVGPLAPEYQEGYEISIDTSGVATVVVTPLGASDDLGVGATTEQTTTVVDLGLDGLQRLLSDLDEAGFFHLPTTDTIGSTDVPMGGDVSNLQVTLVDATWDVTGAALSPDERATLDEAQRILLTAVGLDSRNPTGNPDR